MLTTWKNHAGGKRHVPSDMLENVIWTGKSLLEVVEIKGQP